MRTAIIEALCCFLMLMGGLRLMTVNDQHHQPVAGRRPYRWCVHRHDASPEGRPTERRAEVVMTVPYPDASTLRHCPARHRRPHSMHGVPRAHRRRPTLHRLPAAAPHPRRAALAVPGGVDGSEDRESRWSTAPRTKGRNDSIPPREYAGRTGTSGKPRPGSLPLVATSPGNERRRPPRPLATCGIAPHRRYPLVPVAADRRLVPARSCQCARRNLTRNRDRRDRVAPGRMGHVPGQFECRSQGEPGPKR